MALSISRTYRRLATKVAGTQKMVKLSPELLDELPCRRTLDGGLLLVEILGEVWCPAVSEQSDWSARELPNSPGDEGPRGGRRRRSDRSTSTAPSAILPWSQRLRS